MHLLGEHRHLTLDQRHTAIGTAGAAGILEGPFLHDLGAEPGRGAAQGIGIKLVAVVRADDQQPALPLLPDQILGEAVREHRAGWRHMDDIGATILLAQAVVDGAGIKQNGAAIPQRIGNLQQFVRRQVRDDEAVMVGERIGRRGDIVALLELHFRQREMLVEKLAGGVVVLDRKQCTGHAVIIGRLRNQRQRRFDAGMAKIADANLDGFGRRARE